MNQKPTASVSHVFETMPTRFRPEAAEGVTLTVCYDITGPGGGRWRVEVSSGNVQVAATEDASGATLKLTTDADTFLGLALGKVDAAQAFMGGNVTAEGDLDVARLLPRLFTKYVAPREAEEPLSPAVIIGTLEDRFRPDKAEGLDVTIGYDITGDGGGQWTATVKADTCRVTEGIEGEPTVRQTVGADDFVALVLGKLDPLAALSSGRLKLSGDMEMAQLVPRIFKRYAPPSAEPQPELVALKRMISVGMSYATGPVMGRFLDALKDKKILANVCPRCKRKQLPPREVCAECRVAAEEFVEVGPEGTLVFIDRIYYASPDPLTGKTRETPYGDIRVLLDGCQGRDTFWHILKREDLEDVKRGDRLRPVWAEERSGRIEDIVHFEKVRN